MPIHLYKKTAYFFTCIYINSGIYLHNKPKAQNSMDISRSLRIAYAMKGINQREAAEVIGLSQPQLSNISVRNACITSTLEKIASGLGYSVSEFIALGEEKAA